MKKYLMFLLLIMFFSCFISFSEDIGSIVNRIRYNSYNMIEDYYVTMALRKYEIYDFITQNFPKELWEEKKQLLELAHNETNLKYKLGEALKVYFPKTNDRNRILNKLKLTAFDYSGKSAIESDISEAIHILRKPVKNGEYQYAEHSISGYDMEINETVKVNNEIKDWQIYTHKFENYIYKINFYSKKKIDMFTGNRDSFVHKIVITQYEDGRKKQTEKILDTWINRGQNLEYIFEKAVKTPEISIYFGTKKEHVKRGFLGFEFYISELSDREDNPDYYLIQTLKDMEHILSLPEEEAMSELRPFLMNLEISEYKEISESTPDPSKKTEIIKVSDDKLRYFMYMLGDENISRKELEEKYREMFGL